MLNNNNIIDNDGRRDGERECWKIALMCHLLFYRANNGLNRVCFDVLNAHIIFCAAC